MANAKNDNKTLKPVRDKEHMKSSTEIHKTYEYMRTNYYSLSKKNIQRN